MSRCGRARSGAIGLALLYAMACAGLAAARNAAADAGAQTPMPVVASFSILADMIENVGRDRVAVVPIVGRDTDAHAFRPTPGNARQIQAARCVFINGAGFEGWIERLVRASQYEGPVYVATRGLALRPAPPAEHRRHGLGGGRGSTASDDPHAWHSPALALGYVANIASDLSRSDPAGRRYYDANARRYADRIRTLAADLRARVALVPRSRRRVITAHGAFAYLGRAFDVDIRSVLGPAAGARPSAARIAEIVRSARARRASAVFLENITDPRLVRRIGAETGAVVGGTLYSDALSAPNGPAPSYLALLRHNVQTLIAAMQTPR